MNLPPGHALRALAWRGGHLMCTMRLHNERGNLLPYFLDTKPRPIGRWSSAIYATVLNPLDARGRGRGKLLWAMMIILASRSPRRALLLREAGYRFRQLTPPFHDPPQPEGINPHHDDHTPSPEAVAMDLAQRKAQSLLGWLREQSAATNPDPSPEDRADPSAVILGADTLVVSPDGTLLGQPRDQDEAMHTLRAILNTTHRVITAVALIHTTNDRHEVFCDEAHVHLGAVADHLLSAYIQSGQWQGKAGGYNLFELQDDWPFSVTGDPTTVVGLPMTKLAAHLQGWHEPSTPRPTNPKPTGG